VLVSVLLPVQASQPFPVVVAGPALQLVQSQVVSLATSRAKKPTRDNRFPYVVFLFGDEKETEGIKNKSPIP
jgi:hypothetical protein